MTRTDFETGIRSSCKALFLTSAIPERVRLEGTPKQIEYLAEALQAELDRREENKRDRLVKRARFPVYKTFEGYEYRCVKLPPALSKEELEEVAFLKEKNNLVLYGPVGTGKTHMAVERQILVATNRTLFYPQKQKQRQDRISDSRFRRHFIQAVVSLLCQCLVVCCRHDDLCTDTRLFLLGSYRQCIRH